MSCLSGLLNESVRINTIDSSTSTESGQPIEELVYNRTIKVYNIANKIYFSRDVRTLFKLFDPGFIKTADLSLFSVKPIVEKEVVEFNGENFIVTSVVKAVLLKHIFGYTSYLSRWRH